MNNNSSSDFNDNKIVKRTGEYNMHSGLFISTSYKTTAPVFLYGISLVITSLFQGITFKVTNKSTKSSLVKHIMK